MPTVAPAASPGAPTAGAAPTPVNTSSFNDAQLAAFNTANALGSGVPQKSTPSALLVTSGPARSTTAANVSTLQSLTTPNASSATQPNASSATQPNTSSTTTSAPRGNYTYDGSGNITDSQGSVIAGKDQNGNYSSVTKNGATLQGVDANGNLMFGSPSTVPGSTTSASSDGSSKDPYDAAVASISDPGLRDQFKSTLQSLDQSAQQAYSNIQSLASSTAATDPATQATIAAITAKYDQQIQLMQDKNKQVLGRASSSVAAFGGLGTMSQSFLNDQQSRADARITDLFNQEQSLILKAQAAYQTGNAKALNDAMTQYNDVNAKKLTALNDLLSATNKQVTEQQNQQKIDAAATKQAVTLDVQKSTNLGASVAQNISDAGLTDQKQIQDYIAGVAQEYGITNPDILANAVTKAQAAATKASDSSANVSDTIKNRDIRTRIASNKATGSGSTLTSAQLDTIGNSLTNGDTYFGTKYNGRGADGYVDPDFYNAIYTNLKTKSAAQAQQFLVKYPPAKYINPSNTSSTTLDPAIVNAVTAAAAKSSGGYSVQ